MYEISSRFPVFRSSFAKRKPDKILSSLVRKFLNITMNDSEDTPSNILLIISMYIYGADMAKCLTERRKNL